MTDNYIKNVAIVGANGNVGKFIVEELLKTGKHNITAITRNGGNSTFPAGVVTKTVDYDSQDSLVSALRGHDALITIIGVTAPNDIQGKLIEAAAAAKISWILPNDFGGDPLDIAMGRDNFLGPAKAASREQIEKLGVSSWISVACGIWYEWSMSVSPMMYGFDFKEKKVMFYGNGETKICTSTWPQVGRAVASILSLPVEGEKSLTTHFKNKPAYIASFTISQKDMFEAVLRVSGDKKEEWTITKVPVKEYYKDAVGELQKGNQQAFVQCLYSRAFFPDSSLDFETTRGLQNELLDLPKDDLDEATGVAIQMVKNGFNPFSN